MFEGCIGLIEVNIPDNVTNVGDGVFMGCSSMEKVTMPARFRGWRFKRKYGISKDIVTFV